jgi:hypothetical protein
MTTWRDARSAQGAGGVRICRASCALGFERNIPSVQHDSDSQSLVAVQVVRPGVGDGARANAELDGDALRELILQLGGASDVQVEARHPAWGTLLVGLDGALATVAWDALEGLYQYAKPGTSHGHSTLMIGGQRTDVELRYVVDTSEAADAARTWAHGGKFRPRRVGASLTPRPWKGRPSGHAAVHAVVANSARASTEGRSHHGNGPKVIAWPTSSRAE